MKQISIKGLTADSYTDGDHTVLVWTDPSGALFTISATGITQEELLSVAESVAPETGNDVSFSAQWIPDGYSLFERKAAGDTLSEMWSKNGDSFTVSASRSPWDVPQKPAKTLSVNGTEAQYWEREDDSAFTGNLGADGKPVEGNAVEVAPGITVSSNTGHSIHSKKASVLTWSKDGIYFRLIAPPDLDQETMVRIAEHVK